MRGPKKKLRESNFNQLFARKKIEHVEYDLCIHERKDY
jgi:hypothetical protein